MPPVPTVVIEIDDNSPDGAPPFSGVPSMWSFADDVGLRTRTAVTTFRAMHQHVGASIFRGYPPCAAVGTLRLFDAVVDAAEVTWLSAVELACDRSEWLPTGATQVERSLQALFETLDVVVRHFGPDHVRLVFAFV